MSCFNLTYLLNPVMGCAKEVPNVLKFTSKMNPTLQHFVVCVFNFVELWLADKRFTFKFVIAKFSRQNLFYYVGTS